MQFLSLQPQCVQTGTQYTFLILLFVAIFGTMTVSAQTQEPRTTLSLDQALELALTGHPEIAVALREREAIDGMKIQAAARPNPSVSTFIQDTRSATRETTLEIQQELELGNKRQARIEAADSFYSKSTAELEAKRVEIHADVVVAFYEVLAAQERLSLAQSSVRIAELALDAANKRVQAGKSSPVEKTKSGIAESSARIELNQATSQLATSRKRLAALWGNPLPVFDNAQGQVTVVPELASFNELSAMLDSAPAIRTARMEIEARDSVTRLERSKGIPNVTMTAGVANNQELGLNQAIFGLSVPIPLFDRNQGGLQEALSRKYKAQDELVALRSRLEASLADQYERLYASRQSVALLKEEILPGAQSAFDAANKGFTAGKFGFIDVLDAQRTLFQAQSQYIQMLMEAHRAVAEIERILGDVVSHPISVAGE